MSFRDSVEFDLKLGSFSEPIGVSLPRNPEENSICLVKSQRFFKELKTGVDKKHLKNLGLILDASLWESLENEVKSLKGIEWCGITSSFDQTICDLSKYFYEKKYESIQNLVDGRQLGTCEIDPTAEISQNVFIGDNVKISAGVKVLPGSFIGSNVTIGENSVIFANVNLYPFVEIGKECRIHSGCVIGADGFGYNFLNGEHKKIWHYGGVIIGNGTELGANVTVDSGTFVPTKIGDGTKLDDSVMIAHNCELGKGVIICGQSGVAGSAVVGDFSFISGQCAIANDVKIGTGVMIAGGSIVVKDVEAGSKIAGYPAIDFKKWRRNLVHIQRLGEK